MSGGRTVRIEILGDAKSAQSAFAAVEQSAGGLSGALQNAGKGIAVAAGVAGAALVTAGIAGTKMAADTMAAQGKLQAQLGLTAEEAESLGDTAERVFANNFGDSVSGVMSDIALLQQNIGEMSADVTQNVTQAAYTLRDVFGAGIDETSAAVGVMLKNFDGLSETDAFDLMTVGFQQGANYSGELLDTLREYSPMFASLGMSADQMMATLIAGAEAGAWNLDKVGDAVKEFNIRAQDGSKLTADGFAAIGLNAEEMGSAIAAGGESAQSAFVATLAGLASIEDPLARNAAGVALFGTQWEDLEDDVVLAMANGQAGLEGFQGATERAAAAAGNNLGAALETLKRTAMVLLSDAMMPLVGVLTTVAQWATTQMPRVQSLMETAFSTIGGVLRDDVLPVGERFLGWLGDVKSAFDEGGLSQALGEAGSGLASFASGIGTAIVDGLSGIDWAGLLGGIDWSGAGGAIWGAILLAITAGTEWGGTLATWFAGVLTETPWGDYLSGVWTAILDGITQATEWGETFASWFAGTVTGIAWGDYLGDVWGAILAGITQAAEWGTDFATWFVGVVTGVEWTEQAAAIWAKVKEAWFAITGWGGEFATWVGDAISETDWSSVATTIRDRIVDAANSLDWSAIGETISEAVEPPDDGGGWKQIFADIRQEAEPLTDAVRGGLTAAFNALGPIVRGVGDAFRDLDIEGATEILRGFATTVGTGVAVAVVALGMALQGLAPILGVVIPGAAQIVVGILNVLIGVLGLVQGHIDDLVRTATALLTGDWAGAWDGAQAVVMNFVTVIPNLLSLFAGEAARIINALTGDLLTEIGRWASEAPALVSSFVGSVQGFLSDMASTGLTLVTGLVTDILSKIGELATEIVSKGAAVVSGFAQGILDTIGTALSAVGTLKSDVIGLFSDALSWLVSAGGDVITGLWNGMVDLQGWVIAQATGLASSIKDGIVGAFTSMFSISSPSRVMAETVGEPILQGIGVGMLDAVPALLTQADAIAGTVGDGIVNAVGQAFRDREPDLRNAGYGVAHQAVDAVGQAFRDREPDITHVGSMMPRRFADGVVSEQPVVAAAAQSIADIFLQDINDEINAGHADLQASAAQVAKAIADGLASGSEAAVAAAASMSGGVALELDKLRQQLAVDLELARIVGDAEDIKKLEEQLAKVDAALGGWADGLGVTVTEALDGAQVADKMAAKWDELLGDMDAILSGDKAQQINDRLREIQQQIQWAEMLGMPPEQIELLKAQQAELEEDLAVVGQAYQQAIQNGMVSAWTPQSAADMADKMDQILDGSLAKQMQADLDQMNARIAKATALGWNKELIAEWQKQANQMADDLAGVNSDMSAAAAQGLLTPEAQAEWDKAMGIVTEIPLDKLREVIAGMKDGGVDMMQTLAEGIADGSWSLEDALSLLPEMTEEQREAMVKELERLEEQYRKQYVEAVKDGSKEAAEEATQNLQTVIDMLAKVSDAAANAKDDTNSALEDLMRPDSADGGSGGGGGGGNSIGGPPRAGGRSGSGLPIAGAGGFNTNPDYSSLGGVQVRVYVGNEELNAHIEAEQLGPVAGSLLAEV